VLQRGEGEEGGAAITDSVSPSRPAMHTLADCTHVELGGLVASPSVLAASPTVEQHRSAQSHQCPPCCCQLCTL
jgi:hypothetical protein